MRHAVIFGVTGYAGGHIARELLDRGYRVAGVARSHPGTIDPRLEFRQGSIHDQTFVEHVISGTDVVVLAMRGTDVAKDGASYAEVVRALLPMLVAARARLGVVGGAGSLRVPGKTMLHMDRPGYARAQPSAGRNLAEAKIQRDVLATPQAATTELDWFYLSPPALFGAYASGQRKGTYRLGQDELVFDADGNSYISGEDYAIAFVDEIDQARHGNERFAVGY